jgi:hypothetical protein
MSVPGMLWYSFAAQVLYGVHDAASVVVLNPPMQGRQARLVVVDGGGVATYSP